MVGVSQFLDIWVMESEQFKSNYTTLHYITLKPLFKKLVRAIKRGELQNKITKCRDADKQMSVRTPTILTSLPRTKIWSLSNYLCSTKN